jgi:dynein heavy chain
MNTRAYKSLCYGPGLLNGMAIGVPVTFIIQARNDLNENRQSGRDNFEIRITKAGTQETIDAELKDMDNGQYNVTYQVEEQCDLRVEVRFEDDKGNFVHIRGSPYTVSFNSDNHNAKDNNLNSTMMQKMFNTQLEDWHNYLSNTVKGAQQKKDELKDVNKLIQVKDHIESVFNRNDEISLKLDQLDETVKMFQTLNSAKDSQVKSIKKLFDEWTHLKKVAREVKRDITPLIEQESSSTTQSIKKLEEDIKNFNAELKKRDFYQYKCGVEIAKEKLDLVYGEMDDFNQRITDYGFQSQKFGNGGMIDNSVKSVETIKTEIGYMKILWDHIAYCKENFTRYMDTKWVESDPSVMEDEVKKFQKSLKDMKVDKRCNACVGLMDEIKKWLIFLPLVQELRSESMRPSHW